MGREIKFRAWDKDECKMIPFSHIWFELEDGYGGVKERISETIPAEFREVDEFVLMQYTGLRDKNGVEIYEDDIMQCDFSFYDSDGKRYQERSVGVVDFRNGGFFVGFGINIIYGHDIWSGIRIEWLKNGARSEWSDFEVIGNVHEHAHLIESEV